MQSRWVDRDGTNGIIRAIIRAGFVNWQKLNKGESDFCNPIDELPQCVEIADSQIVLSSQRKKRYENSSDPFLRRQFHQKNDERRMTNDERMTNSE